MGDGLQVPTRLKKRQEEPTPSSVSLGGCLL